MYRFEPESLKQRLHRLTSWGRLGFGVLLIDRAVPNFLKFAAETGATGAAMLRGAQAKAWALLEGANAAAPFLFITAETCEFIAPRTGKYDSLYASAALDAVAIACNVLDCADVDRTELLVESATLRRDSVDMFVQRDDRSGAIAADAEVRLLAHPLMQEELGFQESDLVFLEKLHAMNHQSWSQVLNRSIDLGYGNLRMIS